jgi:crotonobetainyl-CoA:carnitine CoA-transferase CaiB-like acyl-CoA transferase
MGPRGNASERYAPHGAYRCGDEDGQERWIAIAVTDDAGWSSLLTVLHADCDDPRFLTSQSRRANANAVDEFLTTLTRTRDAKELTDQLQAAGVAAYPVQNCMDLHQDENLQAFEFWHWLDHQTMGPSPYEGLQHRLSRTPGALRFAAPVLGQNNAEVFCGMLGLSAAEVEQLKKENVIF